MAGNKHYRSRLILDLALKLQRNSESDDNISEPLVTPSLDNDLITLEDLGLTASSCCVSPNPAETNTSLRVEGTYQGLLSNISSSSEDEGPRPVISTEVIMHNVCRNLNKSFTIVQCPKPTSKLAPVQSPADDINEIYQFSSDDSVKDPYWIPPSRPKKRTYIPPSSSSESDDNVPLLMLQTGQSNAVESLNSGTSYVENLTRPVQNCNLEKNKDQARKKHKKARLLGKAYLGLRKDDNNKMKFCVEKPKREIKPRCLHTKTVSKSHSFMCALISEEERKTIHSLFWNRSSWSEKKAFVQGACVRRQIRRRRKDQRSSKKGTGHDIFLQKKDEKCTKVRVCRLFFLNTLCLGEDCFRRWTKETEAIEYTTPHSTENPPSTSEPVVEYTNVAKSVKLWLDAIPKVPSHYCRSSSNKLYVESTFRSEKHMHEVFLEWCDELGQRKASRPTFLKVLKQENIAIHHPRKDQCDTCCSFQVGNISKEEYDCHIVKKNEARNAKNNAISMADDETVVITVDVQSVLLAPKLLASALYYKLKLQCHNFTVYDCKTKKVTIYFWHEVDGGVSANEFTTCLIDYIGGLGPDTKRVVVISDGCGHQNRNRILSSALSDLSMRMKVTIEQLYLEKGHTMMEVDSVHSTIEQYIKPPIYAPSDYVTRMLQARPKNPYHVKAVHYDFFQNYEALEYNFKSIRPGKKKGDAVVVDIRGLQYFPDGSVRYRLRHVEQWTLLPQRRASRNVLPERLYLEPLKITESKFKHLQELKSVIDNDYHPFYDSISFNPGT